MPHSFTLSWPDLTEGWSINRYVRVLAIMSQILNMIGLDHDPEVAYTKAMAREPRASTARNTALGIRRALALEPTGPDEELAGAEEVPAGLSTGRLTASTVVVRIELGGGTEAPVADKDASVIVDCVAWVPVDEAWTEPVEEAMVAPEDEAAADVEEVVDVVTAEVALAVTAVTLVQSVLM